jgi:hypothetical protein
MGRLRLGMRVVPRSSPAFRRTAPMGMSTLAAARHLPRAVGFDVTIHPRNTTAHRRQAHAASIGGVGPQSQ